jgi:hypothetical protein
MTTKGGRPSGRQDRNAEAARQERARLESTLLDPSLVTLLGGAGGIGLLVKSVLHYVDRELDRRALLKVLKCGDPADVEAVARGLRSLRWRDVGKPDEDKTVVEPAKLPLVIEAPKPNEAPGDEPSGGGSPDKAA